MNPWPPVASLLILVAGGVAWAGIERWSSIEMLKLERRECVDRTRSASPQSPMPPEGDPALPAFDFLEKYRVKD